MMMNTDYLTINDNGSVSPSILWEGAKAVIRGKIIAISSRIKKQRLKKQQELESEINKLQREHKQKRDKKIFPLFQDA